MEVLKVIVGIVCMVIGCVFLSFAFATLTSTSPDSSTGIFLFGLALSLVFLVPGFLLFKGSIGLVKLPKAKRMEESLWTILSSKPIVRISEYDFAVQNKVTRQEARKFLEEKALELGASADANDRGIVIYTFGG